MCISAVQVFFFFVVLSNLKVKCINAWCCLMFAQTVESLQSFFFVSNNNKMHTFKINTLQFVNCWEISAETTYASSVLVLRHDAYYA